METTVTIGSNALSVKEYNNQRVITLEDIDTVHQRPEGTAKRNFRTNKKHFIKEEDYYEIPASEFGTNFVPNTKRRGNPNIASILITESGYLMLAKSFTDDLAWQVQRQLINAYFRVAELTIPSTKPTNITALKLIANQLEQHETDIETHTEQITVLDQRVTQHDQQLTEHTASIADGDRYQDALHNIAHRLIRLSMTHDKQLENHQTFIDETGLNPASLQEIIAQLVKIAASNGNQPENETPPAAPTSPPPPKPKAPSAKKPALKPEDPLLIASREPHPLIYREVYHKPWRTRLSEAVMYVLYNYH